MDSTSGSMQSSSGGDEEYDSRAAAESISVFLNNPPPQQPPPPPQPQLPLPHHQNHNHSSAAASIFDPLSNIFDPLSRSSSSLLNLDMMWSKTLRSEPNSTDFGGFVASSTSTQPFRPTFPATHISPAPENASRASVLPDHQNNDNNNNINKNTNINNNNNNVVRNPKKRSRASRRAPTTVLTTDTSNFRAMVQEFTGIPAPPFTSSPFPRSRLDLFGTSSTLRSAATHLDSSSPPPYLLRPFAQKLQPSSSMADALVSPPNTNNNMNSNSTTSIDYQLSSDLGGFLKQQPPNPNLLNMGIKNQVLNFQSLLQPTPPNDSHLKMGGVLEEFGLGHGHGHGHGHVNISGLPNIVGTSDSTTLSRNNEQNINQSNWGSGVGSSDGDQGLFLRSLSGNGKVNFSASSSDFHGDKGPENVAARSEGMMESWICSTDH